MNYQFLDEKYLLDTYPRRGITIVKGKGIYLFDEKGKKYMDMMSNYGVNAFGYSNPRIIKAIQRQLNKLTNLHCSFANDQRSLATLELLKFCGPNYSKVYWANSGTEAVEAALKFAAFFTGKKRFISAKNSYHGKTLGALSATGKDKYRKPFEPLLWEFLHVEFGNVKEIEQVIDEETAGVILEPIQGEGGIILPPKDYLKEVRKICEKNNVLLILDEIQTGIGRTGTFLASQDFGVEGDIICLGKSLAGGLPVGATILKQKVAENLERGIMTSTFGGNPLVCAATLAVLNLIDQRLLSHIKEMGNYFLENLKKIKSEKIIEVRGKGLMIGIEFKVNTTPILKNLQEKGVLAIPAGEGNSIRFLPPYVIGKREIEIIIKILKRILSQQR
jgi:predicted acetylornithine/succinylornithine family transaminase